MTSFNKKCVFYWLLCMAAVMLDQLNNDSRFSYVLLNCSCISVSHLNDWKCCLNLWIFRLLHVIYTTRCNIHVLQMPKAFGRHLRCKMHLFSLRLVMGPYVLQNFTEFHNNLLLCYNNSWCVASVMPIHNASS